MLVSSKSLGSLTHALHHTVCYLFTAILACCMFSSLIPWPHPRARYAGLPGSVRGMLHSDLGVGVSPLLTVRALALQCWIQNVFQPLRMKILREVRCLSTPGLCDSPSHFAVGVFRCFLLGFLKVKCRNNNFVSRAFRTINASVWTLGFQLIPKMLFSLMLDTPMPPLLPPLPHRRRSVRLQRIEQASPLGSTWCNARSTRWLRWQSLKTTDCSFTVRCVYWFQFVSIAATCHLAWVGFCRFRGALQCKAAWRTELKAPS
jgi:hypothetical protein